MRPEVYKNAGKGWRPGRTGRPGEEAARDTVRLAMGCYSLKGNGWQRFDEDRIQP